MASIELEQPCPMCGESVSLESDVCANCGEQISLYRQSADVKSDADLLFQFQELLSLVTRFWLICGTICTTVGVIGTIGLLVIASFSRAPTSYSPPITWLVLCSGFGMLLLAIGYGTRRNENWALYFGLIVPIGFMVVVILYFPSRMMFAVMSTLIEVQIVRVIYLRRKLHSLGISLDTKQ